MQVLEGRATVDDVDAVVAELGAIGDEHGCTVQAFDARYLVGREHLERAVELADRALERGENVARDRGVEILLYAAGRRQIDESLAMGVEEGESDVAVVIDGEAGSGTADGADEAAAADAVRDALDLEERPTLGVEYADETLVRDFFDVADAELAATEGDLADVVLERVALLEVEK